MGGAQILEKTEKEINIAMLRAQNTYFLIVKGFHEVKTCSS